MMDADDFHPGEDVQGAAPLPNRFTRGTLLGCVGILCVLALPALLAIPVETLPLPEWVQRLVPLVGVAIVIVGAWLLSRVPSAGARRISDPTRPLTRSGRAPVLERPAADGNRLMLGSALALCGCCVVGYVLVSMTGVSDVAILVGTLITYLAGLLLLGLSVLALFLRLPVPVWRWERIAVQRNLAPQALPFACVGVIAVVWSLFIAAAQGYFWAPIGVGALLLAAALTGPILQRLPQRGSPLDPPPPFVRRRTSGRDEW